MRRWNLNTRSSSKLPRLFPEVGEEYSCQEAWVQPFQGGFFQFRDSVMGLWTLCQNRALRQVHVFITVTAGVPQKRCWETPHLTTPWNVSTLYVEGSVVNEWTGWWWNRYKCFLDSSPHYMLALEADLNEAAFYSRKCMGFRTRNPTLGNVPNCPESPFSHLGTCLPYRRAPCLLSESLICEGLHHQMTWHLALSAAAAVIVNSVMGSYLIELLYAVGSKAQAPLSWDKHYGESLVSLK